jgi:hypothetical protein
MIVVGERVRIREGAGRPDHLGQAGEVVSVQELAPTGRTVVVGVKIEGIPEGGETILYVDEDDLELEG